MSQRGAAVSFSEPNDGGRDEAEEIQRRSAYFNLGSGRRPSEFSETSHCASSDITEPPPARAAQSSAVRVRPALVAQAAMSAKRSASCGAWRVYARVRPFLPLESTGDFSETCAVSMSGSQVFVCGKAETMTFAVDTCFWSFDSSSQHFASQEKVLAELGGCLVRDALDGSSSVLVAYGQSGSGKSHAVFGTPAVPGLVTYVLEQLFSEKQRHINDGGEAHKAAARDISSSYLAVSFLEIYQEDLRDLFRPKDSHVKAAPLRLVERPHLGACVQGLLEVPCQSACDARSLLDFGMAARAISSTALNGHSSRSHAVFSIAFRPGCGAEARLTLFDLAGTERQGKPVPGRGCQGHSVAVNRGLASLNLVVHALASKGVQTASGAPFRASKLTTLLQDALLGGCRARLLATLSPSTSAVEETLATMGFASKTRLFVARTPVANDCPFFARGSDMRRRVAEMENTSRELAPAPPSTSDLREAELAREAMLRRIAFSHDLDAKVDVNLEVKTTYLVNMSDDPMLAGRLKYFIPLDTERSVGSASECSIKLNGIGVTPKLCVVKHESRDGLLVRRPAGAIGRVVVAGKLLGPTGESVPLEHGQCLVLGYAFAFRIVVPAAAVGNEEPTAEELLLGEGIDGDAVEAVPMWQSLLGFVAHITENMPSEHAAAFVDEVRLAVRCCDEANEITAGSRPGEELRFEADINGALRPSVVVRVLRSHGDPGNDNGLRQQVYVWSTSQMVERLDGMREWFHHVICSSTVDTSDADPAALDVALAQGDPWHEANSEQYWRDIVKLNTRLEEALEEIAALRMALQSARPLDATPEAPLLGTSQSLDEDAHEMPEKYSRLLDRFERLLDRADARPSSSPSAMHPVSLAQPAMTALQHSTQHLAGGSVFASTPRVPLAPRQPVPLVHSPSMPSRIVRQQSATPAVHSPSMPSRIVRQQSATPAVVAVNPMVGPPLRGQRTPSASPPPPSGGSPKVPLFCGSPRVGFSALASSPLSSRRQSGVHSHPAASHPASLVYPGPVAGLAQRGRSPTPVRLVSSGQGVAASPATPARLVSTGQGVAASPALQPRATLTTIRVSSPEASPPLAHMSRGILEPAPKEAPATRHRGNVVPPAVAPQLNLHTRTPRQAYRGFGR